MTLTNEQVDFIWRSIGEWRNIVVKATGQLPREDLANLEHSALLRRILTGQKVYDKPPPRSYSYPWYSLLEKGFERHCEVHYREKGLGGRDYPVVVINQAQWKFISNGDDGTLYAEWEPAGLTVRCTKTSDSRVPDSLQWLVEVVGA